MEFNEKLQQLRAQKALTQEQLAENYMYQEQLCQNGKAKTFPQKHGTVDVV